MTRTHQGQDWNELHESENPAVNLLKAFGYHYVASDTLETERDSLKDTILVGRLSKALMKLNPWLSDDNKHDAIRAITSVQAASLLDASRVIHTTLTYTKSVQQDLGFGKQGQNVRYLDFVDPHNNEFVVTRQYRLQGVKKQIVPDIVIFVNGIPLVVIECKSPTLGDKWKGEGIEQLLRYQEIGDDYRELGMPKLFETVQLVIVTCGQGACYGTVTTPPRFFFEWKNPYPMAEEALQRLIGRTPTPQDVLLAGLLAPENLLDITRNFTTFEQDKKTGKNIRKVPRYQQFRAVNKALLRSKTAKRPED